jgi:hypothetical protein
LINEQQLGYVPPAATSIVLLSAPIALLLAGPGLGSDERRRIGIA